MNRWASQAPQIGATLATIAGSAAVAYWIYALQTDRAIWAWPMVAAVAVAVLGILAMAAGFFAGGDNLPSQNQSGGDGSRNYQAGRDISINGSEPE